MNDRLYKNYLLGLLLLILACHFMDRFALSIVLQNIKVDLKLSDTQLGLMSGIAFALFYSVMGLPIARWADRGDRPTIVAVCAGLWSILVMLCGFAANFAQLLLIRVGVAVGEAGCIPTANSLIADTFTRAERPRAGAIYWTGTSLAVVMGYFLAGWLNQFYGWRITFMLLGAPGVVFALVAWLTIREPRRAQPALAQQKPATPAPPLREVARTLWANKTYRWIVSCTSVMYFYAYGILLWQPTFFVRAYGMSTGKIGTWFAILSGVGGILGTWAGGEWASRYAANNERKQLRAAAAAYIVLGLIAPLVYLVSNFYVAMVLLGVVNFGGQLISGAMIATTQSLVPQRMRAVAVATTYLFANFIGMGLGPLAAGALSDGMASLGPANSLRYALVVLCPGYLVVAWHFWKCSTTVMRDIAHEHAHDDAGEIEGAVAMPAE